MAALDREIKRLRRQLEKALEQDEHLLLQKKLEANERLLFSFITDYRESPSAQKI
jgi:hypothetical protein